MDTEKLESWIQENQYHEYVEIDIMDKKKLISWIKKLVSWIQKNWYHGYENIGIMDAEQLLSWIRKSWYDGYKKIGNIIWKSWYLRYG